VIQFPWDASALVKRYVAEFQSEVAESAVGLGPGPKSGRIPVRGMDLSYSEWVVERVWRLLTGNDGRDAEGDVRFEDPSVSFSSLAMRLEVM
jgi:hypothetical protein